MSTRRIRREHEQAAERERRRLSSRAKRAVLAGGAAVGATVILAPSAQAATFTVDTLDDSTFDASCADDDCTLREAIAEANAASGPDQITFASGLSGEIDLNPTYGELQIGGSTVDAGVDIQGPGAGQITISGQDQNAIFKIIGFSTADQDVSISGLTLTEGRFYAGGAISNTAYYNNSGPDTQIGDLTVNDSVLTGNRSLLFGGAISNVGKYALGNGPGGELQISGTEISDNIVYGFGGGVFSTSYDASATIADSVIADNIAKYGGGAQLGHQGGVTVTRTTVEDNSATSTDPSDDPLGGGLFLVAPPDSDSVVSDSTITGNHSDDNGGGLAVGPYVDVSNSTVEGNTADYDGDAAGNGGGVFAKYGDGPAIDNSTVTGNSAVQGGGVYSYDNAEDTYGEVDENGPVHLSSTIAAGNSATDSGPDLGQGPFSEGFDADHSLIEDTSGASISGTTSVTGVGPALGPLTDNGGPTETRLPQAGSPAIDAGVANGLTTDQRGLPRTADTGSAPNVNGSDGTDIGSTEVQDVDAQCQGVDAPKQTASDAGETLTGTDDPDALFGAAGDDTLIGLGADDCLYGEGANDTAVAGPGADIVDGGDGDDTLKGEADGDQITGDAGDDTVFADGGSDNADGGDGKDILKGQGANDVLTGGTGNDRVSSGTGDDKASGNAGRDRVSGRGGKDKVRGAGGKDLVRGGAGNDKVAGGAGKDKIKGGDGEDKIKGNGGKDRINSFDKEVDKVNCGGGKDKAVVDEIDKVSASCETVIVRGA